MDRLSTPALTHALRRIAERSGARPPRYNVIAGRVRDGDIPAEFDGKQWWVRHEDVPGIARLFGLEPAAESKSSRAA